MQISREERYVERMRMRFSFLCSLVLHGLLLFVLTLSIGAVRLGTGPEPKMEPIVLNLQPPSPRPPRQLVDARTPADTPPEDTNLISDVDSRAADAELQEGDDPGPRFDEESDLDSIAQAPAPPVPMPVPVPPKVAQPVAEEAEEPAEGPELALAQVDPPTPPEATPDAVPEDPSEDRVDQPEPESPPLPVAERPAKSEGRVHDAVREEGFANYEAIQDELAAYMKEVRRKVERRWNEALLTRYSGTTPTKAEIDCTIAADGTVLSAAVAGTPDDRVYAALCREAIERAGPFGPFTFEVPDIYRNQNLEIRWTFSFL